MNSAFIASQAALEISPAIAPSLSEPFRFDDSQVVLKAGQIT